MSSADAKYAKRKLDFLDKPFHCKTFYIDIKAETTRRKVLRRIKDLGGNVEGFLSKDIDLFITDKKNDELDRATVKKPIETQQLSTKNLSRGRALLMKANAQSNSSPATNSKSIEQNAISLGVKIQQANVFLKDSNKFVQGIKRTNKKTEDIDGITPLEWKENEKENKCCLKIEDTEQLYKPLLKYFETFPNLYFNDEVASPFVKGVILTKQKEKVVNRYSAAKKTVTVANKGGYCEACDYWYRCSLREHIKSAKHEKFVKDQTNFENLDTVIDKLPALSDFIKKLNSISGKDQSDENLSNLAVSEQVPNLQKNTAESTCNNVQYNLPIELNESAMPYLDKVPTENHVSISENVDEISIDSDMRLPIAKMDIEMPCLKGEISVTCDKNEFSPKHSSLSGISSCIVQTIDIIDSEMPSLHKEYPYDSNTQDSGTGPELLVNESKYSSLNGTNTMKRTNSDSALPADDEDVQMCSSPYVSADFSNDNAVFMEDILHKSTNLLVENVTSNVRRKFSRISLAESADFSSEKSDTVSYSYEKYKRESVVDRKTCGSLCFSEISSPSSRSQSQLNFKNLASNWINDINNTTSHSVMKNLEEKNSEAPVNIDENSCSRDSLSLISMPETPRTKPIRDFSSFHSEISESSNSCQPLSYTPDKTLCESESNNSNYNVILEKTPCSQHKTFDLEFKNASSFSELSQHSGYSNRKTTNSEHQPIKLKINLSEIKRKEKKHKRKVKVKRRIFPEHAEVTEDKENIETYYLTQQESDTKIKLRKIAKTPVQKNGNLMTYWKVRKSGGCRLVFSSEKRKANDQGTDNTEHGEKLSKRRKCIFGNLSENFLTQFYH